MATPSSAIAPTANSGFWGAPIFRTVSNSSGASSAAATSTATGTPPRGNATTIGCCGRSHDNSAASRLPAWVRSAKIIPEGSSTEGRAAICADPDQGLGNTRSGHRRTGDSTPSSPALSCTSPAARTGSADVAQLAEHFTRNEGVPGSSPGVGFPTAIANTALRRCRWGVRVSGRHRLRGRGRPDTRQRARSRSGRTCRCAPWTLLIWDLNSGWSFHARIASQLSHSMKLTYRAGSRRSRESVARPAPGKPVAQALNSLQRAWKS